MDRLTGQPIPESRQIRAAYDASTIVVYQAYAPEIAVPTARDGRFPSWYNRSRMTWIKPSFLWMMYRSGWSTKPGQEHVLSIRLHRAGFEWALRHAALSHYEARTHEKPDAWRETLRHPVRVQWDPERDLQLTRLPHRTIQIGLSGEAVRHYLDEWIVSIADVTELAHRIHSHVRAGDLARARDLLPTEAPYPIAPDIAATIGADPTWSS